MSDGDRAEVAERLRRSTGAGYLTLEEYEERIAEVYAARTGADLRRALRELPDDPRDAADELRRKHRADVRGKAAGWATTNGICIGIWAATGAGPGFWPIWPLIFTTVGLVGLLIRGAEGERQRELERAGERPPAAVAGRALVTVLYADIVDSTGHARAAGDAAWAEILGRYERLVADAVQRAGGQVVKMTGDGALATTPTPAAAVRAAEEIRGALGELGLEGRFGLHAGEVEVRDGDVAGIAVHLAQRVCAEAVPSEVLVTRTVVDLVAGTDLRFDDRGERALKGFAGTAAVFALVSA